jgi:polar amino acid transport system permease protein
MSAREILEALWAWTPFLAEGFAWNVLISFVSMAIGTPVGFLLAEARLAHRKPVRRVGGFLTGAARAFPTFVLIFYLAYILPAEFTIGPLVVSVPAWLKASLALAVAVAGFVSDNGISAIEHWRRGEHDEAYLFLPAWTMYFLIIFMASSTASVIGVPEIVQRANTVIAAVGHPSLMLWVYLYAMAWFFIVSWPIAQSVAALRRRLIARVRTERPAVA